METDSIRMLRQRRAELWASLERLRTRVNGLETEIHQIDAGLQAMETDIIPASGNAASFRAVVHHARRANPEAQELTMKQLVLKALSEHLTNGATANEMLDFFAREWGREEIMRTSLSPQLSRLKEDRKIRREGKVWKFNHDDFEALLGDDDAENKEAVDAEREAADWDRVEHPDESETNTATDQ